MSKKCVMSLLLIFGALVFPRLINAASDFSEKDTVLYFINDDGSTHVTQNIKVTNLSAEFYTNKYSLGIGSQRISNVKASDKNKGIKVEVKQDATKSAVNLEFSDQVIGKNSTRSFTIEYDTTSATQKLGTSWNITIPRVSSTDLSEYAVTLSVPKSFGSVSTVFPKPVSIKPAGTRTEYQFSTEQITKSGVTMNFGDKQVYTMGLTYHLNNSQRNSVYTEIALPMNTAFQTIVYDSITPQPQSVYADEDGNYIARYILKPQQTVQVQVIAKAIVSLQKQLEEPPLTSDQKILFTQKQPYWNTEDKQIASLAASLKTPENIYQYVVKTLTYNASKVNNNFDRLGGAKVLQSPQNSVCMEFTDLFVTLARAAGIPAREVNGYAYTNDSVARPASLSQDTLHSWPEYYSDDRGWIPVDPTWENTTKGVDYFNAFDLNHIAFVRKGKSSETPYPAGAYKGEDPNTRDVVINFISEEPEIHKEAKTDIDISESHMAGTKVDWKFNFKNTGNVGIHETLTEEVSYKGEKRTEQIPFILPPFASTTLSRLSETTNLYDDSKLSINLKSETLLASKEIQIVPFYKHSVTLIGILYLLGVPAVALFSYKVLHKNK